MLLSAGLRLLLLLGLLARLVLTLFCGRSASSGLVGAFRSILSHRSVISESAAMFGTLDIITSVGSAGWD